MSPQNLTNVYNQNPTLQSQYTLQQYLDLFGDSSQSTPTFAKAYTDPNANTQSNQGIINQNINQYQTSGGGGGGGGIQDLQLTYTPGATNIPSVNMSSNPAAQLTGRGRLDPMGSGFYEGLNKLEAMNPSNSYKMSTFNKDFSPSGEVVRGKIDYNAATNPNVRKSFYENVYQDPRNLSLFDKAKKGLQSFKDKFFAPKVQGTLGTRLANRPKLPGIVSELGFLRSPFNEKSPTYNPNLPGELNYLEGITGIKITGTDKLGFKTQKGLPMIGRDPNSGGLKYGPGSVLSGKNVISGFGTNSYEDALDGYMDKMRARGTVNGVFSLSNLTTYQQRKYAQAEKELTDYYKSLGKEFDMTTGEIKTLNKIAKTNKISQKQAAGIMEAIAAQGRESAPGRGDAGNPGGSSGEMTDDNAGTYCFDPSTPIQMADGSTKKIKNIQLGDQTKGGEVTGVFQFKATDEIHDYKGVTVAGSHYVKEDGRFIMVKDSPLSVKIDKIPVVYSLDTKGRRIFINDIEFADYNGDGVAKSFLSNAGVDLTGFDKEVLRQVEHRLI